ncbi:hypothetical protein [Listeria seeligeri]|uniref:hypothetical protein n=1 Tax=Listeria seeligeri TaxID=1640 RepID=UPI0018887F79|nr:hypothetical protein [Listeria seeligeri]MBF2355993.1 hypothetical protein [Listeria seeligeri]MBF2375160.1 hypothetical protein [Listeria seeligeri]UCK61837.1 hypothetical protein pLIS51_00161c [Listeria seeligeri]
MDVTLFLVRALSSQIYEKDINNLFNKHALEAYHEAQSSQFWDSKAIQELPPADEIRARKILGLVCLSVKQEALRDELTTIFFRKIGFVLQRYIVKADTKEYYDTHLEEMKQQINALPQRVLDYVLILLDGNGVEKEQTLNYVYTLLKHWDQEGDIFLGLSEKEKTNTLQLLEEYFPQKKFTSYYDLLKVLYTEKKIDKAHIGAFQYFFISEKISTEEYATQIDIRKAELRQLFAIAVQKELPREIMPFYVISGIESLIVAKSYNKLRNSLLKSDLELVEVKHQVQQNDEVKWKRENALLKQENKRLQERIKFLEGEQHSWNKEEIKTRDETIFILEQLLEKKVNELDQPSNLDMEEEVNTTEEVVLDGLKIAIVGGYPKLNLDLKKEIPDLAIFTTIDRLNKSLQQFDYVFLLTSYSSHAMKMKLDSLKVDYFYLASMTTQSVVKELKKQIQAKAK